MLAYLEQETGANPSISIIWMHGLGASSDDFADLAQMLTLPTHLHYRFILPQAPMLAVSINQGYVMPAWYDIDDADFRTREDEQGMQASAQAIRLLIQQEKERGIQSIILGGFSQGGAMALYTGLGENPLPIAAVVSFSAYLPFAEQLQATASRQKLKTPIFMAHGTADTIVPIQWASQSCQILQDAGYPVTWHDYPMQHQLCDAELSALSAYLSDIILALALVPTKSG